MKKTKGFTLIELLAVIAILGTIIAIVTISAISVSNTRRGQDYENIKNIVEQGTKLMIETENILQEKVEEKINKYDECKINYDILLKNDYLDEDIINPVNNKSLENTCVKVIRNNKTLAYEYKFIENDCSKLVNCLE